MLKNNCFITGGSGLLGINWLFHLKNTYDVNASINNKEIEIEEIKCYRIDLSSKHSLSSLLKKINPLFIIHAAAISNVEGCEFNQINALKINVEITKNISEVCSDLGIKLIYISTDHLFDGSNQYASENENKKPINYYAKTKDLAEKCIIEICDNYLIVRSNFFGWGTSYRHSFSDFIINNLRNNTQVNLFNDVYFTPILFEELFNKVDKLIENNKNGIYNIVGNDRLSKFDFGMKISKSFNLNSKLINKISIHDMKKLVIRPLDMSLSNSKYKSELKDDFMSIDHNINMLKNTENNIKTRLLKCL